MPSGIKNKTVSFFDNVVETIIQIQRKSSIIVDELIKKFEVDPSTSGGEVTYRAPQYTVTDIRK